MARYRSRRCPKVPFWTPVSGELWITIAEHSGALGRRQRRRSVAPLHHHPAFLLTPLDTLAVQNRTNQ